MTDKAELSQLIELMKIQMQLQTTQLTETRNQQAAQMELQTKQLEEARIQQSAQIEQFAQLLNVNTTPTIPKFNAFDPLVELWTDYKSRFLTFLEAHSVPEAKVPQVFLTNQTSVTYKLIFNLANQATPPKDINKLTIEEIFEYMKTQFDPSIYVIRERFKYWSDMKRKPGESIPELAARIRGDAVTCDFASIQDPLDEALRTRFMCSINNEAVLKALF